MAVLNPIGVDQTTGQSRTLKSGDTLESSSDIVVDGAALPRILSRVSGINLTATGDTSLYTVPSGQNASIIAVVIRLTTATSPNADATISVGTNAATYDNIIAAQTLTGLDATTESFTINVSGVSHIAINADGAIRFQVDSADTGGGVVATVDLIGYLF